ncbi:syncytin-2 [Cavia porcellus]|uniref:syncytin-2 n=1 Tax=Cavia porcellus TaxID=10141 RepID=UPI002FE22A28
MLEVLRGQVFVCGGKMAFTFLPANLEGLCVMATLVPDIDVISGDEPVPIPSLDYSVGHTKRAVQFIPLMVGLGISGTLATGTTELGVTVHSHNKLSNQLIDDVQALSSSIQDIQDQIDSLAEVVLQNRRGLDLLMAEQGGICLALQECCCFYVNKSSIVQDKIKRLQEDLVKRRREPFESPLWSSWNGILPYLLPLLGPLLGLLILFSLGPFLFNKLMAFVKQQVDTIKMQPMQIHYHRLEMADRDNYTEPAKQYYDNAL